MWNLLRAGICLVLMSSLFTALVPHLASAPVNAYTQEGRMKNDMANKRSLTPVESTWKLEDIYADQAAFDAAFNEVKEGLQDIAKYEGKLGDAKTLLAAFTREDELSIKLEQLYVYAKMMHDEDTALAAPKALTDRASKLMVEFSQAASYITPEVLSLPDETLRGFISDSVLAKYRHTLEEMLRQKAHILSKPEEALLSQVGNIAPTAGKVFNIFNNADLRFPKIKNEQGEEVQLTHGNYITFLESKDRDVRRNAFNAVYNTYTQWKNTLATTYSANTDKNIFYARVRKYPSVLEMELFDDNVDKQVYTNLIATVHKALPTMYRYLALRKKLLGVDELHMYDLFTPLVPEYDKKITFEEAKKIVYDALAPLGDSYRKTLQEGFDTRWIDVYENEGKRSGAYSWGSYGTHPYVLLNHKENLDSMFTLAHEMGHAMHSYHSDASQEYRDAQYPIFLAEVASTTNEALLTHYLLEKAQDNQEKLYLLTHYADGFRTTLFRQTMFAEFEMIAHARAEQGEALTPELLSEIYYDLNKLYYGENMVSDEGIAMEWARIPHFYNSFYVYKYATGFSAAASFSKQILEGGPAALDRYLGFLKSGGSDYPIEILKRAGVDLSTPKPIEDAMAVFADVVDQMEALTK